MLWYYIVNKVGVKSKKKGRKKRKVVNPRLREKLFGIATTLWSCSLIWVGQWFGSCGAIIQTN